MFKRNTKEEENKKIKQQWNYSDVHIAHERRTWTQETVTPFVIQISKFILLYKHIGWHNCCCKQLNLKQYCYMFIWWFGTLFSYGLPFMKSNCIVLYDLFWQWLCIPIHWNMSLTHRKLCCKPIKYLNITK